jgi:hypothetical protein
LGLKGLTGKLINDGTEVELFATSYSAGDTNPTFLYGIVDNISNTTDGSLDGVFTEIAEAPADSSFKGVAFAPAAPASLATLSAALASSSVDGFGNYIEKIGSSPEFVGL